MAQRVVTDPALLPAPEPCTNLDSAVAVNVEKAFSFGCHLVHCDGEIALGGRPVVIQHVLAQGVQAWKLQLVRVLRSHGISVILPK